MENTLYTAISLQEIEAKFARIVEDKIRCLIQENNTQKENNREQYASRKEVSERLRISLPTLNSYIKQGKIKSYRIGRRVLFKWDEVEMVLDDVSSSKYKRNDLR